MAAIECVCGHSRHPEHYTDSIEWVVMCMICDCREFRPGGSTMDEANADYFSRERLDPTLAVRVATVRQGQLQAALADPEADTSDTQTTDQEVK